MDFHTAINKIVNGNDLTGAEMQSIMRDIMQGTATPAQIGGFLVALRMKGETVEEIAAAASVMREFATPVNIDAPHLVDIVGTGGDASNTFNISTTAAFVIAAAGGNVAKHYNRSVSSKSGSADVLEAAGVKLELNPREIADCISRIGVGFMFAPLHHKATRHAAIPRRELGLRTIFNLLGPLTNPANVQNQLIGVYDNHWLVPVAEVMRLLGSRHVMVVHSEDGMDEISIFAPTNVAELKNEKITSYRITPDQFNIDYGIRDDITVNNAKDSLKFLYDVLDNRKGPARDIVIMNAGAAIYTAGLCEDLESGINMARTVIENGTARKKLDELIAITNKREL